MRIRHQQLKRLVAEKGSDVSALGSAVERDGLKGDRAAKAVRNWMRGSDHPRCTAADIRALAGELGVEIAEIARFESTVQYHRGSPQKARLVADEIRGKSIDSALSVLRFSTKRAATNIQKALEAAVADASLEEVDGSELVVAVSRVDEGSHIKRFRPKDRGRAHPILKQTSHITIGLERPVAVAAG